MANESKPNVLIFLCDQLRIDLLACYGETLVRTPNISALAQDSCVFERAYTPCAICSPARASLLTGLYPHGHHMFNNSTPGYSYCEHMRPGVGMIQDWIEEESDYESAWFGKWHVGPAQDLFDSRFHHTQKPYEGRPRVSDQFPLASQHAHRAPGGKRGAGYGRNAGRRAGGIPRCCCGPLLSGVPAQPRRDEALFPDLLLPGAAQPLDGPRRVGHSLRPGRHRIVAQSL